MSSDRDSPADAHARRIRLAELLTRYREMKQIDPTVGIGVLRAEAGDLFRDLVSVSDCDGLLEKAMEEDAPVPETFGPYEILNRLGEGGAGVVYRAHDSRSDRTVALKIVRESLAAEPRALQRFEREAETMARLEHRHVVGILEHGEVNGRLYLAMELLEGASLSTLLTRIQRRGGDRPDEVWLDVLDASGVPRLLGPPPARPAHAYARRIAALLAPIARALASAAEAGLVHRDIKPANLVLDARGDLKLTDFGLVKVFGEAMTSSLAVMGTPLYLSPEQAGGGGKGVDHRSDIFSLGVTLFEALTLRLPFRAESVSEALGAILHQRPPRLRKLVPEYPRDLEVILERCLEKSPQDRYQNAGDLAADLERFARTRPIEARPVSRLRRLGRLGRRHKLAAGAIAATAVMAAVLSWYAFGRSGTIEIRCTPVALVSVQGERFAKNSPLTATLPSGAHTIEIVRKGFDPWRREIDLEPGGHYFAEVNLRPSDLDDLAAATLLAKAVGLTAPRDHGPPDRSRGPPEPDPDRWWRSITVLSPRGDMTRDGLEVRLTFDAPLVGLRLRIEPTPTGEPLWQLDVPDGEAECRVSLPPERVMSMAAGTYRLVLSRDGDSREPAATFTLTEGAGFTARLERLPEEVRGWPEYRLLVIGAMLEDGLCSEAFRAAEAIAEGRPQGRRPLRLMLAALVGLAEQNVDTALYESTLARWEAAGTDE